MGQWKYEGFTKDGKKVSGKLEATSDREVKKLLRGQGIRPKLVLAPSIFETDLNVWMIEKGLAKPFGNAELVHFTKQLAIMVGAGVPILQSLEILYKQQKNPALKHSLKHIASSVGGGKTLSESMASQKGFSKLYCNLVKAGEAAGILDGILEKLTVFLEKQEKIKSQIKSAMTYPTIVVIVGAAVVYGMMVFVVPKFTEMLTETGQELPWITKMVVDISNWLQEWTIFLVPTVIIGSGALMHFIKTPTGKPMYDRFSMNLPLFGGIIIKGNLASFSKTLSTMLSSGVSLIDSLDICIDTLGNTVIQTDLMKVRQAITEGKTLAEPLNEIEYFPPMIGQMVKVGEQTGNIDSMLDKVSDVFENEVEELIGTMTKLIEPIILVVLGGVVAVILVAMYMPIFMAAGGSS